jgi:hypothetical protein
MTHQQLLISWFNDGKTESQGYKSKFSSRVEKLEPDTPTSVVFTSKISCVLVTRNKTVTGVLTGYTPLGESW